MLQPRLGFHPRPNEGKKSIQTDTKHTHSHTVKDVLLLQYFFGFGLRVLVYIFLVILKIVLSTISRKIRSVAFKSSHVLMLFSCYLLCLFSLHAGQWLNHGLMS